MGSSALKLTKISRTEYQKMSLALVYGTGPTKFGNCLAAFKDNVLCYLTFYDKEPPIEHLKKTWSKAKFTHDDVVVSKKVTKLFEDGVSGLEIYLKGTDFEMEVWEALLNVKKGSTAKYMDIALAVGRPKAVRAVGSAVGKNNVAYFVPCHRVVSKNGAVKYGGGPQRKLQMLKDEGAM